MELVYLWVEDYKNIKEEGFNFSPRFTCNYDKDSKELTIDENKEYISIFPENINVTAIVGDNGSGKSSLLSSMLARKRVFIVIFDEKLKVYTRNVIIETSLGQKRLSSSTFRSFLYYSMDNKYLRDTSSSIKHIVLENTNKLITEKYIKLNTLSFNMFDFKPHYIRYEFIDYWIDSEYEVEEQDILDVKSSLNWDYNSDSGVIKDTLNALKDINDNYLIYLFNRFGTISEIFEHIDLTEKLDPKHFYLHIEYKEVQEVLRQCDLDFVEKDKFDLLKKYSKDYIEIEKLESLFGKDYIELFFYKMIDELEFDFMSCNGATYSSLSHGEKTIYSFWVNLVNCNKSEYLLLLDEPDNTLHPNWQKSFLNELIQIIKKLDIKVHIIMTSHSSFLLSDLPKENVIFLKKDEDGNCKNVTKETNIKAFGANIHTLLSHGFFMKDGLMGEFAKGKITEIKTFYEENIDIKKEDDNFEIMKKDFTAKKKDFYHIKSIIGEPFLKTVIKNYLDELEIIFYGKEEFLDKEIERLQNLKANLNDKS